MNQETVNILIRNSEEQIKLLNLNLYTLRTMLKGMPHQPTNTTGYANGLVEFTTPPQPTREEILEKFRARVNFTLGEVIYLTSNQVIGSVINAISGVKKHVFIEYFNEADLLAYANNSLLHSSLLELILEDITPVVYTGFTNPRYGIIDFGPYGYAYVIMDIIEKLWFDKTIDPIIVNREVLDKEPFKRAEKAYSLPVDFSTSHIYEITPIIELDMYMVQLRNQEGIESFIHIRQAYLPHVLKRYMSKTYVTPDRVRLLLLDNPNVQLTHHTFYRANGDNITSFVTSDEVLFTDRKIARMKYDFTTIHPEYADRIKVVHHVIGGGGS